MAKEENLEKRNVKLFLLVIKYIPYVVMLLGMVRTLSYILGYYPIVLSYIGGTSYLTILLMLLTSFVFNFCSYHRVPIYYILVNDTLTLYDYHIGIPLSNASMLDLNLVLIGITVFGMTLLYCKEKKNGRLKNSFEARANQNN